MTQSFFARGEEQEATAYENLAPDDPLLVPREVEFDSFDKIPRRRGSLFAIAVSAVVLVAIGFVTWRSFYYLSRPDSSVAAASRAMVQAPQSETMSQSEAMSIAPKTEPAPPVTEPPTPTRPGPVSEPLPPPAPPVQPTPVAQPAPAAPPAPSEEPAPNHRPRAKSTASDEPARPRQHALRGYVWSPEKHTLVPAEPRPVEDSLPRPEPMRGFVWSPEKHTLVPAKPAVEDPLPAEDPGTHSLEGAPVERPVPDPTSPAPFEPSPSPAPPASQSAPIID